MSYNYQASNDQPVVPRRLELSLNPEDGSLLTAPLLSVLMAATDGVYSDLYQMAHGELEVTSAQALKDDDEEGDDQQPDANNATRKEKLTNLSFAQRRHEISLRFAQHGKLLTHVAALTSAEASTEFGHIIQVSSKALQHARTAWTQNDEAQDAMYFFHAQLFPVRQAPHDVYGACDVMLSGAVRAPLPSSSLPSLPAQKIKVEEETTDADMAIVTAADNKEGDMVVSETAGATTTNAADATTTATGKFDEPFDFNQQFWYDLPQDLRLMTDRYEGSPEDQWNLAELKERWHIAVRDKLIRGEVGMLLQTPLMNPQPRQWKVSLRGGIVRLTHGKPRSITTTTTTTKQPDGDAKDTPMNGDSTSSTPSNGDAHESTPSNPDQTQTTTKLVYPIEAVLTVLSVSEQAEWTLLSVDVNVQARTGESNHQLETSNRQRYDLHRLCSLAMAREEATARKANSDKGKNGNSNKVHVPLVAQPLDVLFRMTHIFQLSWQLEILSAQAQALRKGGLWTSQSESLGDMIVVTPVQFDGEHRSKDALGAVSISFWSVDDRYGGPKVSDLTMEDTDISSSQSQSTMSVVASASAASQLPKNYLTLTVRAEAQNGIRVSLSGAESILAAGKSESHVSSTIQELLTASSNPFSLSASAALLAATKLCAERRCGAVVQAMLSKLAGEGGKTSSHLPSWMSMQLERGSIAVAAKIAYHGVNTSSHGSSGPAIMFRLTCDARTGRFIPTFSRKSRLLQLMACNDLKATESTALRVASLATHRRGRVTTSTAGRAVRDAFDSLARSMNVLGQRVGVGGSWNDASDQSFKLRERAIQMGCADATVSLITCCGMAAVYGLSAMAVGVGLGISPSPDMAGDSLNSIDSIKLLPIPPLSILIDQQLIEKSSITRDGEKKKQAHTEQEQFGICCSVNVDSLTLYPVDMHVNLDSPHALPSRVKCALTSFAQASTESIVGNGDSEPAAKRLKTGEDEDQSDELVLEVERFADILVATLGLDDD